MEQDYSQLIQNLKNRRYDEALREPALSDAFHRSDLTDCLRYTLESMLEVDPAYAYKVYANSRRIHDKISKALTKRGYQIDYRYQGALKTHSNIMLYGDVEIIVIKKTVSEKPYVDIQTLALDLMDILSGDPNFRSIDYSDKTRIRITAIKPTCEIDILPSIWVDSSEYLKTKNEIYRGIAEFDFVNKKVKKYLPFLNIARINAKDQRTNGNLKSIARLLTTLRTDSDTKIDLRDSEIIGILYNISDKKLCVEADKVLSLLPMIDKLLEKLAANPKLFNSLLSPSEKDRIFAGRPDKQGELSKLRGALHRLVHDVSIDLDKMNLTPAASFAYN